MKAAMSWLLVSVMRARAFRMSSSVVRTRGLSSKKTVFIDGEAGTTGLQVRERLATHEDIEIVSLEAEERKDPEKRREVLNSVDAAVLCLPDEAAIEAMSLLDDDSETKIVDASTAHRINANWRYGFPEMTKMQRDKIADSKRIANPGCYATGYLALTRPLVDAGLLGHMEMLTCSAISGYSGGGKALTSLHESDEDIEPWGAYGLNLDHKHLPEMRVYSRMDFSPVFLPAVGHFKQGMVVSIFMPFGNGPRLHAALEKHYENSHFVNVAPLELNLIKESYLNRGTFLDPTKLNDTNNLDIFVFHSPDHESCILTARLDNLGKGASGAAVQNLNIILGLEEHKGTDLTLLTKE